MARGLIENHQRCGTPVQRTSEYLGGPPLAMQSSCEKEGYKQGRWHPDLERDGIA